MQIELDNWLMKCILVLPITMLLQRQFDSINKIVVGTLCVLLMFCVCRGGSIQRKTFNLFFSAILVFLYSLVNIEKKYFSINMLFYYPLWFLYLSYAIDSYDKMRESFYKNQKLARGVIWIWSIAVVISFFIPTSYDLQGNFQSFSNGNFRFAPTIFFMSTLIWVYSGVFQKRKYMLLMIIPFISMVATGSRTYTIILLVLMIMAFYNFFEDKRYFIILIVPCIYFVGRYLGNSQFIEKFGNALNNPYVKDPLAAITSNRSVFWKGELELFSQANIIEKLLGGGLTASFVKNVKISGQAIWAHNDFMELLNAHGIVGLILYSINFINYVVFMKKKFNYTIATMIVICVCCIFNAFFNGLYVYTTAMLSIPFLAYAVTIDFRKSNKQDIEDEGENV